MYIATRDCNFLANLSFTRPRLSPIFLTRLHETMRPESIETSTNSIFLAFLLIEILIYTKQRMAFKLNFVAWRISWHEVSNCIVIQSLSLPFQSSYFLRRPQKLTKSSPSIWHYVHSKCQVNGEDFVNKVIFIYDYTWQNFRLWILCLVNKTQNS